MSAGFIEAPGQIAIAATFVAEPVETPLSFWLRELGIAQPVAFAPYNQVFQQLLDPSSLLAANQNGINVILARPIDWQQAQANAGFDSDAGTDIERNARDFARALIGAAARSAAIHLVFLCPASPDSAADPALKQMEELIMSELRATPRVHVVTSQALAATYPVAEYYDAQADKIAHMPYTPLFFTALGSMIARKIHALKNSGYKVIVLDGDQTLWDGVCGEDGPAGIRIGAERKALQEFMVEHHNAGMLLCLCSANNEEDLAEVFSCHPEMPLKREHFAASRINWRPKSENIKALAKELQLGLDSFIFIDDDDVACAEVQTHCPEVLTLQLPREVDTIPTFLRHLWVFDRLIITEEAGQRTVLYTQHAQREQIRQASSTLQDFLTSLDLKIQIMPLAAEHLARVAELTQRTNQFNLTTIRRSEAEIQARCQGKTQCQVVRVIDRFGDYGMVGVVIFEPLTDALSVDTFLLSCRALGRGVEYRMLAALGQIAKERGLSWVDVGYCRTQKNRPALDFLNAVADPAEELGGDGPSMLRLSAEAAAALRHIPPSAEQARGAPRDEPVAAPTFAATTSSAWQHAARLRAIALARYDVHQIQKAISAQARKRVPLDRERSDAGFVAPRTPLEQQLAAIFAAVLKVDRVSIHDNFFDFGGDSFLVVRVLAEIERACGRRLSVATLFQAPTVEEIGQILAAGGSFDDSDTIVPLNPHGTTPPLFSVWMGIATKLRELSRCLGPDQRMYGISSHWDPVRMPITRIEEMAACYVTLLRKIQPHGPYYLSSDCLATLIALEMAQQLLAQGEQVAALILIDPLPPRTWMKTSLRSDDYRSRVKRHLHSLANLSVFEQFAHLSVRTWKALWGRVALRICMAFRLPLSRSLLSRYVVEVHERAKNNYEPKAYSGKIWFIWAADDMDATRRGEIQNAWSRVAPQATHRKVPGLHVDLFKEPYVSPLAEQMKICLSEARTVQRLGVESVAAGSGARAPLSKLSRGAP